MIRPRTHIVSAAIVSAAPLLIGMTAAPASAEDIAAYAAKWNPGWSSSSATESANITLDPAKIQVATHLKVSGSNPRVKKVQAIAGGPNGTKLTTSLSLKAGTTKNGTWRGTITVPPQSPAGNWKVGFTATSTKGQTSTRSSAASFTITKTPPPALSVTNPIVVGTKGTAVTIQAFWGRRVDGAYATLTAPGGGAINGNMSLVRGNADWGLWKTAPTLPENSRPGTWKITTQYVSGGAWSAGPTTTITVKQHSSVSLKASATKIKKDGKVKFTGRLAAWKADGKLGGLAKQKITLYFLLHAAGAQWGKFRTITTDSNGYFSYSAYIRRSGTFKINYAGAGLYTGSTSRTIFITVK